jgi:excisionase family DNA binding protein
MNRLNEFLQVTEAAEYLGVSPNTLRNWENAGKIIAHRHPVNGYRLFKQDELDVLLESAHRPSSDVMTNPKKPK